MFFIQFHLLKNALFLIISLMKYVWLNQIALKMKVLIIFYQVVHNLTKALMRILLLLRIILIMIIFNFKLLKQFEDENNI